MLFKRLKLNSLPMLIGLLALEIISYSSSKQGLMTILGIEQWASLLAFSFVAVDFAGAGLLFFGDKQLQESYWMMFCGWLLTVFGDVGLCYLNVANSTVLRAPTHILVTSGQLSQSFFAYGIPLLIALLVAFSQVALVHGMNILILDFRSGKIKTVKENQQAQRTIRRLPDSLPRQRREHRDDEDVLYDYRQGLR